MKKRIRTTQKQRTTLALLKERFAEQGYFIFPVAPWYRKHHRDFAAVPKEKPVGLVVVHPMRDGSISVRPFDLIFRSEIRKINAQVKTNCPIRWSGRRLPSSRTRPRRWDEYLPASAEIRQFIPNSG
jgi:hypothetical protein